MLRCSQPCVRQTTDRRAVCGRSACTVRREGGPGQPVLPTPIDRIRPRARDGTKADGGYAVPPTGSVPGA
jgi:hypothetical protein